MRLRNICPPDWSTRVTCCCPCDDSAAAAGRPPWPHMKTALVEGTGYQASFTAVRTRPALEHQLVKDNRRPDASCRVHVLDRHSRKPSNWEESVFTLEDRDVHVFTCWNMFLCLHLFSKCLLKSCSSLLLFWRVTSSRLGQTLVWLPRRRRPLLLLLWHRATVRTHVYNGRCDWLLRQPHQQHVLLHKEWPQPG